MPARSIVKRLDVIGDIFSRDLSIVIDSFLDSLLLQTAEEGFGNGIVPAVTASAHTGFQMVGPAKASPVVTPILRTLVRMNHSLAVDVVFAQPSGWHRV